MLLPSVLTLLLSTTLATAAKFTISIPSTQLLPNPGTLPPSTHAILTGAPGVRHDQPIRRDSSFTFPSLDPGSYLLTIHTRDFFFAPLRVDVSRSTDGSQEDEEVHVWQTFRGNEWSNKGASYGSGKGELRIEVKPAAVKGFYQDRGGFNLLGFLKSPMILMGLVSVVFIFGLPYLMDNSELNCGWEESGWSSTCMLTMPQWIPRPRRSLRRCRRAVPLQDQRVRRTSCRTLIWRAGWRAKLRMVRQGQARRRSKAGYCQDNITAFDMSSNAPFSPGCPLFPFLSPLLPSVLVWHSGTSWRSAHPHPWTNFHHKQSTILSGLAQTRCRFNHRPIRASTQHMMSLRNCSPSTTRHDQRRVS